MTDILHICVIIYIKTSASMYNSDHITYILEWILSFFHCEMCGKDELQIIFKILDYHCILLNSLYETMTNPNIHIG